MKSVLCSIGSKRQVHNDPTRCLQLAEVFGAWIKKQRSPNNPSDPGEFIGITLFTYCRGKGRQLCAKNITFECTNEDVCQTWTSKINEYIRSMCKFPIHCLLTRVNTQGMLSMRGGGLYSVVETFKYQAGRGGRGLFAQEEYAWDFTVFYSMYF